MSRRAALRRRWSIAGLAAHPFEVASLAACKLRYYTVGMAATLRHCFVAPLNK